MGLQVDHADRYFVPFNNSIIRCKGMFNLIRHDFQGFNLIRAMYLHDPPVHVTCAGQRLVVVRSLL